MVLRGARPHLQHKQTSTHAPGYTLAFGFSATLWPLDLVQNGHFVSERLALLGGHLRRRTGMTADIQCQRMEARLGGGPKAQSRSVDCGEVHRVNADVWQHPDPGFLESAQVQTKALVPAATNAFCRESHLEWAHG